MVYVFPYNEHRLKQLVNTDNAFFKKENYYAVIDNGWQIDNSIEQIFWASYETAFGAFLDKLIALIKTAKKWDTIVIENEEKELIYKFLNYTYLRSWYGETQGCCLLWQAIEWDKDEGLAKYVEFDYKFDASYSIGDNKITVDKTIYNDFFIQGEWKDALLKLIKNMEISLLLPQDINDRFITNESIFAMFEKGECFEEAKYFVPLDPNICLVMGPKKTKNSFWVTFISKDNVDFINDSIFFIKPFEHHSRYIVSYDEQEIDRIIKLFWVELIKKEEDK